MLHRWVSRFLSRSQCSRLRQAGSTLMEVLVALVVLSFGLLGQAGLQAAALKVNQGAMLRTHATTLAYDILDRMRANRMAAQNGGYDNAVMGSVSVAGGSVASTDMQEWQDRIDRMLPNGDGLVCRVPVANAVACGGAVPPGGAAFFLVQVQWVETDDANADRVLRAPVSVVGQL